MTESWPARFANKGVDAMTFSGGVAEYLYKRETRGFGDLGSDLAEELRHALAHRRDLPPARTIARTLAAIPRTLIGFLAPRQTNLYSAAMTAPRVDLLTREFPPDVYGGAGVHV